MKAFAGNVIQFVMLLSGIAWLTYVGVSVESVGAIEMGSIEEPEGEIVTGAELYLPPTLSKEVTYLIEPVDEDGVIDYFAALETRARNGVTFENNAAILFLKARVGEAELEPAEWELYCNDLGVEISDLASPGFQPLGELNKEEETELSEVQSRPWTRDEFPRFYKWIDDNAASLELIIEGTCRPECYFPSMCFDDEELMMNIRLPAHQACRAVAKCLVARAMLRLGEDRIRDAEQDLLATHRLARLLGRTPMLMCGLVACAIDRVAGYAEIAMLKHADYKASEALSYQQHLRSLLPLPVMIDNFDYAERLSLLNAMTAIETKHYGQEYVVESDDAKVQLTRDLRAFHDGFLQVCNERFDQFTEAGRIRSFSERVVALDDLVKQLRKTLHDAGVLNEKGERVSFEDAQMDISSLRERFQDTASIDVGREFGAIVVALMLPHIGQSLEAEIRGRMREDQLQIGFALAAYYADHHEFPESLGTLVPKYLSSIPLDRYNDQEQRFVKQKNGYVLYSVGANGIDDQGHTFDSQPPGDDIVLQVERVAVPKEDE